MESSDVLFTALASLETGAPTVFDNLTVVPFVCREQITAPYLTFPEAAGSGLFRVTEISAQGSVPELAVVNDLLRPVLMVDGDELVGAKQNRVLNVTVLVPPKSTITVPVSCVEHGRWHAESAAFHDGDETLFAAARAAKMAQVGRALAEGRGRRSEQAHVWDSIAAKQQRMQAPSATGAVDSVYLRHKPHLERFERAFKAGGLDTGAVFAVDGRPLGLELFDAPETYARYLPRLVRSYALDAIETAQLVSAVPSKQALDGFLATIGGAERATYPGVGLGEEVRLEAPEVAGAALVAGGTLIHVCVFALEGRRRRKPAVHVRTVVH